MSTSSGTTSCDVVSVNYQPTRELNPVPEKDLEVNPVDYFPVDLSFPKRPPWDFNMTPAQLDAQEQRYFKNYVDGLQASQHWKNMSYFELNLETWRQLWRVLEMCDILLLIVDVRYAGMMFPPSLYTYIQEQKKDMILVLNKIDLVPSSVVAGWKQYLTTAYPALRVLYFTSCPSYNLRGVTSDKAGETILEKADTSFYSHERYKSGVLSIGCVGQPNVGKSSLLNALMGRCVVSVSKTPGHTKHFQTIYLTPQADTSFYSHERYKSGVLSIGCVGQPNVGKSSLLNALMGRCVVSVSKTPGHTKHFQTIYLTPQIGCVGQPNVGKSSLLNALMGRCVVSLSKTPGHTTHFQTIYLTPQPNVGKSSLLNALMGRCVVSVSKTPGHTKHFQTIYLTPQVRLCDCPGLVFPSTVPRPIQILMGSYPIAQLREPYTTIRLDMPKLLRIEHPEGDETWSPRDICDGWAKKKGYLTAKAARLDTFRAANSLLRMALDGRICLWLRPPGFAENREIYETCDEIKYIRWVQALTSDQEEQKSDVLTCFFLALDIKY
ncbi:hypothetical protein HW555_013361 [Spodoptera exigua]|uniref:Guanine nucleotide-binding protein-like 1 n=1 Tax=Spodoptera exigua TaxID=7107 RepID=A0A835KX30_SPOEX|nr:hypothetical protein HW555_013361 [Spodoptera exigua]